jgi:hypothetical protein
MTAVSAVLRHSWPEKIKNNLIVPSDKGIVFVKTVILRNGTLQQGSPTLEISSGIPKLDDASLATVTYSAPFDPFPENFKSEKLETRVVFRYGYLPDAPFKDLYEAAQREVANQNYTSAAQLLEALVAKDPDYTNAWNYLGWLYNKLGKYENAAEALKKAIVQGMPPRSCIYGVAAYIAYIRMEDPRRFRDATLVRIRQPHRIGGAAFPGAQ